MLKILLVPFTVVLIMLSGCAEYENRRGVAVTWEPQSLANFAAGTTTRREVMDRLGPPSQMIALGDETVLYYLYERSAGTGLVLVVYNRFRVDTTYDRAVFFFDKADVLTDYATQIHPDEGV